MKQETRKQKLITLDIAYRMVPYLDLDSIPAWVRVYDALLHPLKEHGASIPPTLILIAQALIDQARARMSILHVSPEDVVIATTDYDCGNLIKYRAILHYEDAIAREADDDTFMSQEAIHLYRCFGSHPDKYLYR